MKKDVIDADNVVEFIHQRPRLQKTSNLSNIKRVLSRLNNPQNKFKAIHITGTNGKGSTSYYLNNLLVAHGQKVGLFTSPFVISFNERIQINSRNISNVLLASYVTRISEIEKDFGSNFYLTEFEYLVVIAYAYFADQNVDFAIIETGIGAKRDKTNVITPVLSIITSIGMDHANLIGPSIEDIAVEKSGIIKPNIPVILGHIQNDLLEIVLAIAKKIAAPVFQFGQNYRLSMTQDSFKVLFDKQDYHFEMRPEVEQYDVAMAVLAFNLLGFSSSTKLVETAINQTFIPGRYQILAKNPLMIIDGGHNLQAFAHYRQYVESQLKNGGEIFYLIVMMKDKDLHEVISQLPVETTILSTIKYPRAAKKDDFVAAGLAKYQYCDDFSTAFEELKSRADKNDIIALGGSYYFVTDFLKFYQGEAK